MAKIIREALTAKGIRPRSRQELSAADPFLSNFDIKSASFDDFIRSIESDLTTSPKAKLIYTLERLAVLSEMVQEQVLNAEGAFSAVESTHREGISLLEEYLVEQEEDLAVLERQIIVAEKAIRERTGLPEDFFDDSDSEEASEEPETEVSPGEAPTVAGHDGQVEEEEDDEDFWFSEFDRAEDPDEPHEPPPGAIPVPGSGIQARPGHIPGAAGAMIGEEMNDESDIEEPVHFWRGRVAPLRLPSSHAQV
eukprot:s684_g2.t1